MTTVRAETVGLARRWASVGDSESLADMNAQRIRGEGHRNAVMDGEPIDRIRGWLPRSV